MVLFEALFNVVVLVDYGLVVEFVVVFPVVVFVYIIEFVVV